MDLTSKPKCGRKGLTMIKQIDEFYLGIINDIQQYITEYTMYLNDKDITIINTSVAQWLLTEIIDINSERS